MFRGHAAAGSPFARAGAGVGGGAGVIVDGEGGGHDALAVWRDVIEAAAADLGDEAVAPELGDLSADVGAATFGFAAVDGGLGPQSVLDVGVAEADDDVLA